MLSEAPVKEEEEGEEEEPVYYNLVLLLIAIKTQMTRVLYAGKHDIPPPLAKHQRNIKIQKWERTPCHVLLNFHNKLSTEVTLVWDQTTQQSNQRAGLEK